MNFYIADMHLGHKNVLKFDNRPFESVTEMDMVLLENWNRRVSHDDDVYILGDMCYHSEHSPAWYLKQLKGKKHVIQGNHDGVILKALKLWGVSTPWIRCCLCRTVENVLYCVTFLLQNGMVFIKEHIISTVTYIIEKMGCISTCVL